VRWLLNLAYMTLANIRPASPAKYRISRRFSASKDSVPRFVDIAPAAGLNSFSMAVVSSSMISTTTVSRYRHFQLRPMRAPALVPQHGAGNLHDRAAEAGLSDQLGG